MRAHTQEGCPVKRNNLRRLIGGVILFVVVIGRPTVYSQALTGEPTVKPVAAIDTAPPVEQAEAVRLLVGRSTILNVGRTIARVSLTSADVADAHVTAPGQLLINGKAAGTISMFVWDRAGAIQRYEINVQRDLSRLVAQLKELFPNETMEVRANGRSAVLSGAVTNKDVIEKAGNLAASFVDSKEELINLLQIRDGAPSNQVLLRVRFAEVSRSAMTELGASFAVNGYKDGRWFGRSTTQQFPAPAWDQDGKFIFSDFLNLFLFDTQNQIAGVIRALQAKGLFQSLAEPNLVAESGKEASFLAGGEFPIPIAQSSASNVSVSVQFKEFGVRLNFTPTVNGDRVHLKVRPEVSTLDFNNAVVLSGFRIPAITTRRTETELELQNGQTFAIAGLINNQLLSSVQKVPGLGHIPILGLLFTSKAAQKNQTELVVMITPEILPNNSRGVTTELPKQQEEYLQPLPQNKALPPPPPAFQSSMATPGQSAAPSVQASTSGSQAKPSSEAAAAAMTAMSAATRNVVTNPASPATTTADSAPGTASPTKTADSPNLTAEERRALEKARKVEEERAKQMAKQAEADRRRLQQEAEKLNKAARAQAQRDAEEAKKQAEIDKKREAEAAEAGRRLREAQAAYEAELARIQRDGK
jgi:pilus assembly protein CpaC